ncbi:PerC family transcriptional regulator [Pantoea sp. SJZ147]|uniref:PerC family transcriptional regulator n=1 Tax=Pantoea sp. SJZ147 TaxID=2572896 RepID=UPI0011A3D36E|nr:PerC family transcriptional regulator [Pantoea sp. SJZ147]TWD32318.1 PerC transcriptional activator [Pantoea sp. SJZ147]
MEHDEIILECLRTHGGMSMKRISETTGIKYATARAAVFQMCEQLILIRNQKWLFTVNTAPRPEENEDYLKSVQTATQLESKGLWLRASHNWLNAMMTATFEHNRQVAKANSDKCAARGALRCSRYSGIDSGKISDYWQWEVHQ